MLRKYIRDARNRTGCLIGPRRAGIPDFVFWGVMYYIINRHINRMLNLINRMICLSGATDWDTGITGMLITFCCLPIIIGLFVCVVVNDWLF